MATLSPELRAALAASTVRVSPLVFLDYETTPVRLWAGVGSLDAGGHTWSGIGDLGSIEGLEVPAGETAPEIKLRMSCVARDPAGGVLLPEIVHRAKNSQAEVKGRAAIVYYQHFDASWQPLDPPYQVLTGLMDKMTISAPDENTRIVEVSVEWVFARRSLSPFGYLSDTDQKARYPTDRGLELMASMQTKTTAWPRL